MKRLTNYQQHVVRDLIGSAGLPNRPEVLEARLRIMTRIAVAGWLTAAAFGALCVALVRSGGWLWRW